MLPRWLTALPRLAITYRDEILVVALGLAYQAGTGHLALPRHEAPAADVVVRIAEAPHAVTVVTPTLAAPEPATIAERRALAREAAREARMAAHAAACACARVTRAASRVRTVVPAPQAVIVDMPVPRPVIPRVRASVSVDAGENIAAALGAGLVGDTAGLPDVRATLAQVRAAVDEARIRAAIQKALAAEQAGRRGAGRGV